MKLADFLVREAIITDLLATTKEGAFREIVHSLQAAGHLTAADSEELIRTLLEREELCTQSIGRGVACPEGPHRAADRVIGTIALSRRGVEFGAFDGKPVETFVLLFCPPFQDGKRATPEHIFHAWQAVAPHFQNDVFLDRLRQCRTREEVFDLIVAVDRDAPGPHPG